MTTPAITAHTPSTIAISNAPRRSFTRLAYNRSEPMNTADGALAGDPSPSEPASLHDRQLAIWLALLTFATYAYFQSGGGWNQNSQFDLTRAIVERRSFSRNFALMRGQAVAGTVGSPDHAIAPPAEFLHQSVAR